MIKMIKEFLKRILPPPTRAFNREVERILTSVEAQRAETKTLQTAMQAEIQSLREENLKLEYRLMQHTLTENSKLAEFVKGESQQVTAMVKAESQQVTAMVKAESQETMLKAKKEIEKLEETLRVVQAVVDQWGSQCASEDTNRKTMLAEMEREWKTFLRAELERVEKKIVHAEACMNGSIDKGNKALAHHVRQVSHENEQMILRTMEMRENGEPELIVSFTSFPARIDTAHIVAESLLNQSKKADRVLLWLAEEQFPNKEKDLPSDLLECCVHGLEIRWCDDLRPHKKYFYAMQEYPNSVIITVDDDIHYKTDMVEILYKSYLKFPYAVSCLRAHDIAWDDEGKVLPYSQWRKEIADVGNPSMNYLATGVSGVLYPPASIHEELFNKDFIKDNCVDGDDLWLKAMQVMANTPTVLANVTPKLDYIGETQECSLWHSNCAGENDVQLNKVLNGYDKYGADDRLLTSKMYCAKSVEYKCEQKSERGLFINELP